MAAAASGYPATEAKKRPDSEAEKKINKISISYTWQKTNRTKMVEVMGRKIDAPRPDVVELSWVKNTTLEGFKKENHNPTADELAQTSAESIDEKDS
jgi:methylthioribose-1-phosphate isomerase